MPFMIAQFIIMFVMVLFPWLVTGPAKLVLLTAEPPRQGAAAAGRDGPGRLCPEAIGYRRPGSKCFCRPCQQR